MNVIADICVIPIGVGVSVSDYVTACQKVLIQAGLAPHLHAYGTNVEGEWDTVMAAVKRCQEAVHEMGALTRLHICGQSSQIIGDMVTSGADIIDLDWMVDIGKAAAVYGERVSFCGNFDPVAVMLQGTPERVSTTRGSSTGRFLKTVLI